MKQKEKNELLCRELRFGNYINWYSFKDWLLDTYVDKPFLFKIESHHVLGNISNSNEKFEGIPLTHEWLLKLSFVQWGNSNAYGNGKIIIHKRKRGWVINTKTPIIVSVHQLMNYSFAITGKELTIK